MTAIFGREGLSIQRNAAIDWLFGHTRFGAPNDVVVFFDDDFVPARNWLAEAESQFREDATIVGLTGVVLADGAALAGYCEAEAEHVIAAGTSYLPARDWRRTVGVTTMLYGCNMAVRGEVAKSIRLDENLPLYAWLEDFDFSARILRFGRLVRSAKLSGVHLGTKIGRTDGRRLGYSQVANPIYLSGKGTMPRLQAGKLIGKNVTANLVKALLGDDFIDRRGRLLGNLDAAKDIMLRRLHPSRIVK